MEDILAEKISNQFVEEVKEKFLKPLPGLEAQLKMAPETRRQQREIPNDARVAGVMILLFEIDKKWNTILIRRAEDGQYHSAQISFPGGKNEKFDVDIIATACRECEEEIGIKRNDIEVLGTLTPIYIPPSNFVVTATVGFIPNAQYLKAEEKEVQEIIQVPLEFLFHPKMKKEQEVKPNVISPTYHLDETIIVWGATAMLISELEHLLNLPKPPKQRIRIHK
jgi:8-oxo-dGTP pyrophosphatase MutT (NUDIX family)